MSIADQLTYLFPAAIRARGRDYHLSGAVDLVEGDSYRVHALVSGGDLYRVDVTLTDDGVAVSCTCPYFDGAEVCKHIWATLLTADEKGYLADDSDDHLPYGGSDPLWPDQSFFEK